MKTILAIETSCDETGIAIVVGKGKDNPSITIQAEELSSQIAIHKEYGGVVPHLAAREHEKNLPILLEHLLKNTKISHEDIDLIAVTKGPGLSPALWRGISFAKELSEKWQKPLLGVDHMEGHIAANFIGEASDNKFPILALTVSGGHTQLVLMRDWLKFDLLGETVDDAAGEAFDKVARMIGLPYPGGPEISRIAKDGDAKAFPFPRPMEHSKDYNFSFSGLKTAVLYTIEKLPDLTEQTKKDIAASFQQAVIDVLIKKTLRAAEVHGAETILLAGGVAANEELRNQLGHAIEKALPTTTYHIPPIQLATDNAAMIGAAAYIRMAHGEVGSIATDIVAEPARLITD